MIRLEETVDEYLVAIPADQRERAKRIRPRRWDSQRTRWVYPREHHIYDALIAEFAEDAAKVDITRPETIMRGVAYSESEFTEIRHEATATIPDIEKDNEALKEQMAEIRQSLNLIAQENHTKNDSQISELQNALAAREQTIEQLRQDLAGYKVNFKKAKEQIVKVEAHSKQLEKQLANSQSLQSFDEHLKQSAIDATTGDRKFSLLLNRLAVDRELPNSITRAIGTELSKMLDLKDREINLYGLLSEAADSEALPKDALDLAHLIRKQRNIVTHYDIHQDTYKAREVLCLFAAALLWPEFPE